MFDPTQTSVFIRYKFKNYKKYTKSKLKTQRLHRYLQFHIFWSRVTIIKLKKLVVVDSGL